MDYQKLLNTAIINGCDLQKDYDTLSEKLQNLFESELLNAAKHGCQSVQFSMHDLIVLINPSQDFRTSHDFNYTDLYFAVDQVASLMADEAQAQDVNLIMQKLTDDLFCLRYDRV